ncbi:MULTISPECIES: phosphate ABC transporter permease PstA [Caldisericum]|jgi:phosphate transport system permease protein|uniref:Phosphate transport system permease protein PstA n=1 Tax=Caldisericum exile TaxID=693075 RepID=A0A2J6WE33_9BACT|nr:MAG: phosphate ABC transporter, permease protein PstA [Caldisericum exile]PMP81506.1 MAG: phosphate ABC transporter, permease protein PstA [Caldisericum exile]
MDKTKKEFIFFTIFRFFAFVSVLIVLTLLFYIFSRGLKVISLNFIIDYPRNGFTEGGILPSIVGSIYLLGLASLFAVPIGVLGGIYLSEYTKENTLTNAIRLSIDTLSGIPSIIFGLFGLAVFSKMLGFKISLLSGSLTLSILMLPTIFSATIESLKLVPKDFRDASFALGATKWQTTFEIVLKTAMPNIITGVLLSIGRAIGETAPILFTGATFYTRGLPTSIFEPVMALPYTIYGLLTEGTFPQKQVPIAFGASIVLILIVFIITLPGIIIRNKYRSNKKW